MISNKKQALVVGINGSPRKLGNTGLLLRTVLAGAEAAGATSEDVFLPDYHIQPCIACERCRTDKICTQFSDDMHLLYPKVQKAQGLVLGSPTHSGNVTAWMKAFLDRLYCFYDFSGSRPRQPSSRLADRPRAAAVIAVGEDPDPERAGLTLPALKIPLQPLGYELAGELGAHGYFEAGEVKNDAGLIKQAHGLGHKLGQALKRPVHTFAANA